MSWDIFVQYIPDAVKSAKDMPGDYSPRIIGTRSEIITFIREIAPFSDFSNLELVVIDNKEFSIEINLCEKEQIDNFTFHIRGGDLAVGMVSAILQRFNLRAFDPNSETGIFEPIQSAESLKRWREYRNKIVGE